MLRFTAAAQQMAAAESNRLKLATTRAQVIAELGPELEEVASRKIWEQVRRQGWMKISQAREVIGAVEQQQQQQEEVFLVKDENADARRPEDGKPNPNNAAQGGGGKDGKGGKKVTLSVPDAMANMLAASEELNRAKKAEERKSKTRGRAR